MAGSYLAGCGCPSEHGGWRLLSAPSWALEGTSCVAHEVSCNLGGNHAPTVGYKVSWLRVMVLKGCRSLRVSPRTHLTDAMGLVYDKPSQKASFVQVL